MSISVVLSSERAVTVAAFEPSPLAYMNLIVTSKVVLSGEHEIAYLTGEDVAGVKPLMPLFPTHGLEHSTAVTATHWPP